MKSIKAYRTDATVNSMVKQGFAALQIIEALAEQKQELSKQIERLLLIAPRKIVVDGKVMIYHCPDHLVPESPLA